MNSSNELLLIATLLWLLQQSQRLIRPQAKANWWKERLRMWILSDPAGE
jgi:hypothetical protein